MAAIRLEFAQFGHFDYFKIYRNLTSTNIEDLGQPIGTSSTMYYEDSTVEPNFGYFYRVGVVRGSIEEFSDEIIKVFTFPEYANTYLSLNNDTIDRGTNAKTFINNGVSFTAGKSIFNGSQYLQSSLKSNDFAFGNQPFTIELVVSVTAGGGTAIDMRNIYQNYAPKVESYANLVLIHSTFVGWSNGSVLHKGAYNFTAGIEYAVAITRDELNKLRFFVDGHKIFETTDATNISSDRYLHIGIGRLQNGNLENQFNGTMRDVRIKKGVAKYISDYIITYQK